MGPLGSPPRGGGGSGRNTPSSLMRRGIGELGQERINAFFQPDPALDVTAMEPPQPPVVATAELRVSAAEVPPQAPAPVEEPVAAVPKASTATATAASEDEVEVETADDHAVTPQDVAHGIKSLVSGPAPSRSTGSSIPPSPPSRFSN